MFQQSSAVCAVRVCVLFSQCLRLELVTIISGCERSHHLSQHKMTVTSPYFFTLKHCFSPDLFLVTFSNCRLKATHAMHSPTNKPPPDAKNKHPCSQLTVLCYRCSKINWQFLSYIHIFLILKINSGLSALKLHSKNCAHTTATQPLTTFKKQFQY